MPLLRNPQTSLQPASTTAIATGGMAACNGSCSVAVDAATELNDFHAKAF